MNEEQARKILGSAIMEDNSLDSMKAHEQGKWDTHFEWLSWKVGSDHVWIDDYHLSAEHLEAIAWWMRNKK